MPHNANFNPLVALFGAGGIAKAVQENIPVSLFVLLENFPLDLITAGLAVAVVITFFVIGPQSTLPLYIWSSMRRTIDPSINTISTLLLAVTLVLFAVAFALSIRRDIARWRAEAA